MPQYVATSNRAPRHELGGGWRRLVVVAETPTSGNGVAVTLRHGDGQELTVSTDLKGILAAPYLLVPPWVRDVVVAWPGAGSRSVLIDDYPADPA